MTDRIRTWSNAFRDLLLVVGPILLGLALCEGATRLFVQVRHTGPTFTEFDPLYGKALKKNFSASSTSPEFSMTITTNAQGFRGPEFAQFPIKGRSILFLGDSFTMGYGVDDGQEFPALVRRSLAHEPAIQSGDVVFVNMGVGNYGNGGWLKFLMYKADDFNPYLIVFQMSNNDFTDNIREGLFIRSQDGELAERPLAKPRMRMVQDAIEAVPGFSSLHMLALARQATVTFRNRVSLRRKTQDVDRERLDEITYQILKAVFSACRDRSIHTILLLVNVSEKRTDRIHELVRSYGTDVIKIPTKTQRPDLYYEVDGHWRPQGHAYVAEILSQRIRNRASQIIERRD